MAKKQNDERQPIIIVKKVKKVAGGHHGGAWKVAYADFVTAMMAFFLLLWLLNVTTDEQKAMISSYFAPADPRIATSTSGAGGVMGGTTVSPEGAMTDDRTPISQMRDPSEGVGKQEGEEGTQPPSMEEKILEEMDRVDNKAFNEVQEQIKAAIESNPDLKELSKNLLVDMTPEGLRIQIVDQEGKPMFEIGSAKPLPEALRLLKLVTEVVKELPNKVSIRGHTDSIPYGKGAVYTNWELSTDRANASRRAMMDNDLDIARVENVQGKADREHLVPNDPTNARNRRISVILLKQSITSGIKKPEKKKPDTKKEKCWAGAGKACVDEPQTRKHEEGVIYFP